jgi:hypothetical protein
MAVISVFASVTLIEILPALPVPLKPIMGKTIKYININDKFLMFRLLYLFPVRKRDTDQETALDQKSFISNTLTCPAVINKKH